MPRWRRAGPRRRCAPPRTRQRHGRHDHRRLERRHAPALDEQQHEQEQRRGERGRQERQRGQRRHVGSSGRGLRAGDGVWRRATEREQGDRRLQQEDRTPSRRLVSAPPRPARPRRRRRPRRPRAGRALASPSPRQQLERRADHARTADRLDAARGQQHVERGRQSAGERGGAEHERCRPRRPRAGRRRPSRRPARRRARGRVERRQHPGDLAISTSNSRRMSGSASVTTDESASSRSRRRGGAPSGPAERRAIAVTPGRVWLRAPGDGARSSRGGRRPRSCRRGRRDWRSSRRRRCAAHG